MLRGNWRFVFTALGCVSVAILLWLAFLPREPYLPFDGNPEAQAADYYAGGSNCRPDVLARVRGKEAASERDRCAESAEQHRLQSNDLIQQTRAADAAQESAWMAYEATRIALAGLLGGFLTIIAAGFAAYYARRAYLETKRTADLAKDTLEIETRPFLFLESVDWKETKFEDGEMMIEFTLNILNSGVLPATNVRSWTFAEIASENERLIPDFEGKPLVIEVCPAGITRKAFEVAFFDEDEVEDFEMMRTGVFLGLRLVFDTRFTKDKLVDEFRWASAYGLREKGRVFLHRPSGDDEGPTLFDPDIQGEDAQRIGHANGDNHRRAKG